MTDQDIRDAIAAHGAKAVNDAAYAAMRGDLARWTALGFAARSIAAYDRAMSLSHKTLTPDQEAQVQAECAIELARIPRA